MIQTQRHNDLRSVTAGIMLLLLLVACGIDTSQTLIPPTIQAAITLTAPVTQTPTLTATMEPTFAYWATAQDATFSAESIQSDATQQAIFDLSAQFPQLCGFDQEGTSISPDGEWIANDCRFMEGVFRVFRTSGDQVWDVPYSAVMKYYPEFIGSVRALHWSHDGNTLYFTSSSCCADTDAISNGDALYRLDLQSGDWAVITEGPFSYYSFSPDGEDLLYVVNSYSGKRSSVRLHFLELGTGHEDLIDVEGFEQAGWAVWRPDGRKIALRAQTGSLYSDDRKDALIVVDVQTHKSQTVIPLTAEGLAVTGWSNDDLLTIRRANVMEYNDYYVNVFEIIFYDLKNNSFVTPIPTP